LQLQEAAFKPHKIMERVPPFSAQYLQAIAQVLADTVTGLTGTQIGYLLNDCRIPDVTPQMTKWKRLFNAFVEFQNQRQFGNHVVVFINENKRVKSSFLT